MLRAAELVDGEGVEQLVRQLVPDDPDDARVGARQRVHDDVDLVASKQREAWRVLVRAGRQRRRHPVP